MAPERHDQDSSRSRHAHRSRRDRDDGSVDSGYGGSAANSPKDAHDVHKDALRDYHVESARHHAESSRRSSRSEDAKAAESKADKEERESASDSDYDPRDKYYLKVDDDEYNKMTSAATEDPVQDDRDRDGTDRDRRDRRRSDASERHRSDRRQSTASERDRRERRERRESDASNSSRRSDRNRREDRDRDRQKSLSSRRHSTTSDGSDSRFISPPARRINSVSLPPRLPLPLPVPHPIRLLGGVRRLPGKIAPAPGDQPVARRSEAGSKKSPTRSKSRDESAQHIDPDGEAAKNFLDKLTKGVDMKSVGKVGLDAAAVAAIKIAVGTQVPWKQRIPRTITVGAAAAIMDFIVKKTNFKPKGMIGTIYARQFVEIVLANLIVNPVSSKVTGAAQNAKGKAAAGKPGGGGKR
ncbi:hypothetical protein INS49_004434 [Diaporthe citri]|uniref:uncharacterized protein n=1 Tax=Diaporthe citri TaxID=83186 RepID=UPI001C7FEEFE|nr:uncharacterized protein INS49_004434 [Diaporthe citri]KAG6354417.1 hypothetical protein INS49_004434 [Diaporthe citri]